MIKGILGDLYSEAGIFSEEVCEALIETSTERTGDKDSSADENCMLWVGCTELYIYLQTKLPVEEDWGRSDQWVVGVVSATMDEIKEALEGKIRGLGFDDLWATLEEVGAIAVVEGVVTLPHLAGKIATLGELLKRMDRQRGQLEKLEPAEDDLLQDHDDLRRRIAKIKKTIENTLGVAEDDEYTRDRGVDRR